MRKSILLILALVLVLLVPLARATDLPYNHPPTCYGPPVTDTYNCYWDVAGNGSGNDGFGVPGITIVQVDSTCRSSALVHIPNGDMPSVASNKLSTLSTYMLRENANAKIDSSDSCACACTTCPTRARDRLTIQSSTYLLWSTRNRHL